MNVKKVSILMNCYNGQEYLKEAIDSVFLQEYENWEIVFVDNCSTDGSADIAKSYGEKLKYFKTSNNVFLGAARNFGIEFCDGDYISFLDCDDVWLPEMLDKQVAAIESGDYALAYAGQLNIDADGLILNEEIPRFKRGNILNELLNQYDVPLVTAIIHRGKLKASGLNFDPNVKGSEEYCLFMQLAVNYDFIVIPEALVKYRILSDSLTVKTIESRGEERRYTLNKILEFNPGLSEKYSLAFDEAFARSFYYDSQYYMSIGDKKSARQSMAKIKNASLLYYALYAVLFFPASLWFFLQSKKYSR